MVEQMEDWLAGPTVDKMVDKMDVTRVELMVEQMENSKELKMVVM
jgi:hypothetical protein